MTGRELGSWKLIDETDYLMVGQRCVIARLGLDGCVHPSRSNPAPLSLPVPREVKLTYVLLRKVDGNAVSFIPVLDRISPNVIQVGWPDPNSPFPENADARFNFSSEPKLRRGQLTVSATGFASGGIAPLAGDASPRSAQCSLCDRNLELLAPSSPDVKLTPKDIFLRAGGAQREGG